MRRNLKSKKNRSAEDAQKYSDSNKEVKEEIKVAKEKWIQDHSEQIQSGFESNNTRKAFKSLSDLTSKATGRASTVIRNITGKKFFPLKMISQNVGQSMQAI